MRKTRWIRQTFFISLLAGILWLVGWVFWQYHGPASEHEIFQGVFYGCERLPNTAESGGLIHWVRADLNVPGVKLYATATNLQAKSQGYEYKLRYVSTTVADEGLAAAVNGTLFGSKSRLIRLPGDLAASLETVVADHKVNHLWIHTYLLWWDDNMIAHMERTKPPSRLVLAEAKWGIGGQQPILLPDLISKSFDADKRTIIAADPEKKLVWIACFDKASFRFAAMCMANHGAKIATAVDGGTSTTMAIGAGAINVRPGTVTGNWRPVATQFGFYADPLR